MRHIKLVSKRPLAAIDIAELPVDIQFIIDLLNAFVRKKTSVST